MKKTLKFLLFWHIKSHEIPSTILFCELPVLVLKSLYAVFAEPIKHSKLNLPRILCLAICWGLLSLGFTIWLAVHTDMPLMPFLAIHTVIGIVVITMLWLMMVSTAIYNKHLRTWCRTSFKNFKEKFCPAISLE